MSGIRGAHLGARLLPAPSGEAGSPQHPPPMGHPSLMSTGRGDEVSPRLDPDPPSEGAVGTVEPELLGDTKLPAGLERRGAGRGGAEGPRAPSHPPSGQAPAAAARPMGRWPFVLLRSVLAVSGRSSPLEWR